MDPTTIVRRVGLLWSFNRPKPFLFFRPTDRHDKTNSFAQNFQEERNSFQAAGGELLFVNENASSSAGGELVYRNSKGPPRGGNEDDKKLNRGTTVCRK